MKNLADFDRNIEFVLTDIDDTLTNDGQLGAKAYDALWKLHDEGFKVIPITGRPAGWCEMIARLWPISAIVGENGGFYFRYAANNGEKIKKMQRWFFEDEKLIRANREKLNLIQNEVLSQVNGSAVASDQFCRLMDLAIDFCEDVPKLSEEKISEIVHIFHKHGAEAKVSSIHVNGWFGKYDKLSTSFLLLKNVFGISHKDALDKCIFVGDSPNDEPMFEAFPLSFGVANVLDFKHRIKKLPKFISSSHGGHGFCEIAERLINIKDLG